MATLKIKNLDDELYERLKTRAQQQHRSVAQKVTRILKETLGEPEPVLSILALEGLGKELWTGRDAALHVANERASWV